MPKKIKESCDENKKIAVKADSTMYFDATPDGHRQAREYAIKLLDAGMTFLSINVVKGDC